MHPALTTYDFLAPGKILFGWGRRTELASEAKQLARRALIVSGSRTLERSGVLGQMIDQLTQAGIDVRLVTTITREPLVADVDDFVAQLAKLNAGAGDCVIAIGGGSAIDLAKAGAALATNRHSATVKDFLEGVGSGLKISQMPLPLIALPTTAGTGTEATKNAVISSLDPPFKKSLRSELMLPRVVIVDPELTVSLPATTTAYTGMDAITQLLESAISRRAKPIPHALCIQGLGLAIPAIIEAVENGSSQWARTAMSHAALLSGLALANSGLGMAHGVAAALGVTAQVPHGLACAVMLPATLRTNRSAAEAQLAAIGATLFSAIQEADCSCLLRELLPRHAQAPSDAASVAERLSYVGESQFTIECIDAICERLRIPRTLAELGVTAEQLPALVKGARGNSMDGNPRDISDAELLGILTSLMPSPPTSPAGLAHADCASSQRGA